jgi:modification methylase
LNARIYGAAEPDQALTQSIEAVGILNAVIIDQRGRILSGTRRWKACKVLAKRHRNRQFTEIPAEVFKGSELEAQRLLIHANRQREKTLEQKTREYREVLRLETELAKQRRIANLKKGSKAPEWEIFPTRGRAAEIAAKATGLGFKTLGKFLKLVEKADEGDAEAKVLVDKVNRNGCRPTTAYDRVFGKIEMPLVGVFESELSALFVELSSNLTSLTKLLKSSPALSGKNRAETQAVVVSLRKVSTEAGERAERLEDALRITAIPKANKLALCNVSPGAPLFKWLNKTHCGDCVSLMNRLPAGSVGLIVTSPPYNLRNSTGHGMQYLGREWPPPLVFNGYESSDDAMPHDEYVKWQRNCLTAMMRVLREDGAIFYNHKWRVQDGLLQDRSEIVQGFPVRQIIIWQGSGGINLNSGYFLPRYEVIYLICKPEFKLAPNANVLGDVWNVTRDADIPHPHPFPVELAQRCIQCTTADVVLDPFIGSGSTAIAAENLKRSWIGIDISRKYCEMADRRIEKSRMSDDSGQGLAGRFGVPRQGLTDPLPNTAVV